MTILTHHKPLEVKSYSRICAIYRHLVFEFRSLLIVVNATEQSFTQLHIPMHFDYSITFQ